MLSIKINAVDKTKYIRYESLSIQNVLTNQVDTCRFTIYNYGTKIYKPVCGDEVIVYDNATKIFAGVIASITEEMPTAGKIEYKVECTDYTRLADRKLVSKAYTGQTVAYIINDIVSTYLTGFTTTNVVCSTVVNYIAFNYETFSACIKRLADLTNYDWYIDEDKDVHFFDKTTNTSPFNLTDTNGYYIVNSLKIKRDVKQLRNLVYIRGAEYIADTMTAPFIADGSQRTFVTPYKFDEIKVTVSGSDRTVGIDYTDDEDTKDCLYNFNDHTIKFKEADKPANGIEVRISGKPYVPLIVETKDSASIAQYGEYHFKIIDKSIKTKEAARERGKAELETYKAQLSEGSFTTHKSGLRSGQYINIQSTLRGLDEDFVINRVTMRVRNKDEFWYDVSLVTTKTYTMVEFLQRLLVDDERKLDIEPNAAEVVDRIWTIPSETLRSLVESTITFDYQSLPWYCFSADPTGIVGFSQCS